MRGRGHRPTVRVAVLLVLAVVAAGCSLPGPAPGTTTTTTTPATTTTTTVPTSPVVPAPRFDGDRALALVREQVTAPDGSPRYRVPGTPGNDEVAQLVADKMEGLGFEVAWHHFNATYGCSETPMHNVVAQRDGTSGRVVVLGAHYDSRPIADKDADPQRRAAPILGANDGGSGVAVLLELARVLPPTNDTVRFVFFDGEDGGGYKGNECTDWILGSRAYAASLTEDELGRIRAFVLVDMVGDPNLAIPYEAQSRARFVALQDAVYAAAAKVGHDDVFVRKQGWGIEDDHVPFLDKDVPSLDLIHTSIAPATPVFPAWHHTHDDDMDAVSAASLDAVGETLETWLRLSG